MNTVVQSLHDNSVNLSKSGGKAASKAMRKAITEIETLESENKRLEEGRAQSLEIIRQQNARIAQLNERVGEYDNAVVNADFTWHDASEPPDDSRAVYCIIEDSRGAWIRLGTFQHGRWKDTNTFENIGCDKWHELPKSPMQRERALKEQS